jgi:phenylacetate-CoA ligase
MSELVSTYLERADHHLAEALPAAAGIPGVRRRLDAAGLGAGALADTAALARLPVLGKDELISWQASEPPFGGLLAEDAEPPRIFQSPGPLYEPQRGGEDPWRWRAALEAAGFTARDVVLNAFGYHLTPAGVMFELGARALGATVIPAGIGNAELQARACRDLGATAYIGLPSYLKALLEKAAEANLDPASWPLERAFVGAEPLPTSLRAWIEERGLAVRQGYGTAETGNLGYECDQVTGLHLPEDAFVEVCDSETGERLWDGRVGEVVVTLYETEYPLLRFGTGDLSAIDPEPCACGIPTPRLRGVLGRVGEAVKVRGMFLHPRQATEALAGVEGVERFRLVVERVEHRDVLRCELQIEDGDDGAELERLVGERIRATLRFNADVVVVDQLAPNSPPIVDLRSWE